MARKFTYDEVKTFIETDSKSGCKLVSKEYLGSKEKLDLICSCGQDYSTTFYEFRNKRRQQCKQCGYNNGAQARKKTHSEFVEEIYKIVQSEYTVLGEYMKDNQPVEMIHNVCGYKWSPISGAFLQGTRCPKCQHGSRLKTHDEYLGDFIDVHGNKFEIMSEYKGANKKIKIMHKSCQTMFQVKASTTLGKNLTCPNCGIVSRAENIISQWLKSRNFHYIPQYKIEDCKYKKALPFDFAIFNHDNSLRFLIEYDGEQHYTGWRGAKGSLNIIKRNDQIKNDYCKNNNIKLFRIPYWDFDILEETLEKIFTKGCEQDEN